MALLCEREGATHIDWVEVTSGNLLELERQVIRTLGPKFNGNARYYEGKLSANDDLGPLDMAEGQVRFGLVELVKLSASGLPTDGYRLALSVAAKSTPVTGLVHCSNEEYGRELNLRPQRVSDLFALLKRYGFVKRLSTRVIMTNPRWCFRGTPEQQRAAIEEWVQINPPMMVRSRKKTGEAA